MTKISQYSALPGDLANGDLFDLSEDQGGGAFASKSVSYLQLKTNLNSDLSFSNTIYTADGVLAGNRIIDGGAPTPDLSFTNLGAFALSATASIAFNTNKIYLDVATGNVGIGTATPGATLEVTGQVKITGGTPGASKVLTSDANGLATWQAVTEETTTASNVGAGGVGVFKQKTGVDLEFKKINAGSGKITITDDTVNNEVDINVDETQFTTTFYSNDGTLGGARTVNMNSLALGFTNASAGVAIGSATANAVAILDLTSTTEGFLPPRMTTTQRDAIAALAGLVIYNSTTNKLQCHNGTTWNDLF
jgi:hypothetical protein|tara:strand:+ start:19659 stop:20579 length:921 start_codon:yes stop_codon:yes gene_type:complete